MTGVDWFDPYKNALVAGGCLSTDLKKSPPDPVAVPQIGVLEHPGGDCNDVFVTVSPPR